MKHAKGNLFEPTLNPFEVKWGADMKIKDSKKVEQKEAKILIPEKESRAFDVPCLKCGKPSKFHNGFYDTDYRKGDIMFLCEEHQVEFFGVIKKWRDGL